MEEKKTAGADLEKIRGWAFFVGLVIATAAFVVALEFSFSSQSGQIDADFLDEIAEDMELMPPIEENLPEPETVTPAQSDQIAVVDNPATPLDEEIQKPEQQQILVEVEAPDIDEEKMEETIDEEDNAKEDVLMVNDVDQLPLFPGGMTKLLKWLTQNLKYPERAKVAKVSGRVVVAFVVNVDGSIDDVRLVRRINIDLDNEALRVIRMMPNWEPGKSRGKNCKTLVHLPIVFKL